MTCNYYKYQYSVCCCVVCLLDSGVLRLLGELFDLLVGLDLQAHLLLEELLLDATRLLFVLALVEQHDLFDLLEFFLHLDLALAELLELVELFVQHFGLGYFTLQLQLRFVEFHVEIVLLLKKKQKKTNEFRFHFNLQANKTQR